MAARPLCPCFAQWKRCCSLDGPGGVNQKPQCAHWTLLGSIGKGDLDGSACCSAQAVNPRHSWTSCTPSLCTSWSTAHISLEETLDENPGSIFHSCHRGFCFSTLSSANEVPYGKVSPRNSGSAIPSKPIAAMSNFAQRFLGSSSLLKVLQISARNAVPYRTSKQDSLQETRDQWLLWLSGLLIPQNPEPCSGENMPLLQEIS